MANPSNSREIEYQSAATAFQSHGYFWKAPLIDYVLRRRTDRWDVVAGDGFVDGSPHFLCFAPPAHSRLFFIVFVVGIVVFFVVVVVALE